jgi:membrane protein insertase Oxa1/YidC/SpoIIIJ
MAGRDTPAVTGGCAGRPPLRQRAFGSAPAAAAAAAPARGLSTDGGSEAAAAAAAAAGPSYVGDTVRLGLEGLQATTGLPWWATLAACGAGLRLGLLPLSKVQETHIGRLQTAMPALREHLQGGDGGAEEGGGRDWSRVRAALRQARCSPLLIVGPPLLQIASFVSLTMGVRTLALHSSGEVHDALSTGGCLWFSNLTVPDELWALPLLHVSVVLLNLELGLGSISPPPPTRESGVDGADAAAAVPASPGSGIRRAVGALHTGLNMTMLTVFPLISELPQAVFVVWLSTSTSSLTYQLLLKPYLGRSSPSVAQDTAQPRESAAASLQPQGRGKQFKKSSTKLPETLAADMRHVKEVIANCSWADAPPTAGLVKKLQKLLDTERKKGAIRTPLVVVLEKDALDPRKNSIGIKLLR